MLHGLSEFWKSALQLAVFNFRVGSQMATKPTSLSARLLVHCFC